MKKPQGVEKEIMDWANSPTSSANIKGRILIVEDDPAVRMAFVFYFRSLGYFVAEEEQGNYGLYTYRAAKEPWTFVVSDFQFIPGLTIKNGADLVAAILGINPEQRLCIHSGEPEMAQKALRYLEGVKKLNPEAEIEILQKPVRLNDLRLIIEK